LKPSRLKACSPAGNPTNPANCAACTANSSSPPIVAPSRQRPLLPMLVGKHRLPVSAHKFQETSKRILASRPTGSKPKKNRRSALPGTPSSTSLSPGCQEHACFPCCPHGVRPFGPAPTPIGAYTLHECCDVNMVSPANSAKRQLGCRRFLAFFFGPHKRQCGARRAPQTPATWQKSVVAQPPGLCFRGTASRKTRPTSNRSARGRAPRPRDRPRCGPQPHPSPAPPCQVDGANSQEHHRDPW